MTIEHTNGDEIKFERDRLNWLVTALFPLTGYRGVVASTEARGVRGRV